MLIRSSGGYVGLFAEISLLFKHMRGEANYAIKVELHKYKKTTQVNLSLCRPREKKKEKRKRTTLITEIVVKSK